jgi:rhodanese-related sulfurtransferase
VHGADPAVLGENGDVEAGDGSGLPARRPARAPAKRTLVEVPPAKDYEWAHLPGAVNHPLKELDAGTGQLDRSRPVIVCCPDWY